MNYDVDTEQIVAIPSSGGKLEGILNIPSSAQGLIVFAHGSGSSRLSPRNQAIAHFLRQSHFATLLFDLLTEEEDAIDERTMEYRFNIEFLAERLLGATRWLLAQADTHRFPLGYLGASTGAAAALIAASQEAKLVKAVVSRGGRPDLAGTALSKVKAASLLIVGGDDTVVIELNEKALKEMHTIKKLEIIPGATHLFEEPGKLEIVAKLADAWFREYLV